jgi:hypothetical protein
MGIKVLRITCFLLLSFVFSTCEKFEIRGFFLAYESADQRFDQSMKWNNGHPYKELNVPVDDYSISVMSDNHVGGTRNLDFFLNEAIAMDAIAAVMVGDLTTGHSEDYKTFQQHLPDQDSLLSFQIIGNHDLYFDGWKQFYSLFGSTTYLFTVRTPQSEDLFICLDSGSGTLGSKQLGWLKNILNTKRLNYRHCILFMHNNLFRIRHTTSANPYVEEVEVLMELCIKDHIDMIVTGHDHQKNEFVFGNTTHITMDALMDDNKNAGYLNIVITQGKIDYEFVCLKPI